MDRLRKFDIGEYSILRTKELIDYKLKWGLGFKGQIAITQSMQLPLEK